eukprot:m.26835 g.26835  ORF g.26835 m.26835 type:complete len:59 (-) comp15565_c0_seq1:5-181(-)
MTSGERLCQGNVCLREKYVVNGTATNLQNDTGSVQFPKITYSTDFFKHEFYPSYYTMF